MSVTIMLGPPDFRRTMSPFVISLMIVPIPQGVLMLQRDSFEPSDLMVVKRAGPSTFYTPGSFVRLRSGGPLGVIQNIDAADRATVAWLTNPPCTRVIADVCLMSASSACEARQSGQRASLS